MKKMLVNVADQAESRVALVDSSARKNELIEIYIERAANRGILGNIYKAIVVNIEPSIQAAFVDCGVGQNGFLHVSDVMPLYGKRSKEAREKASRRGGRGRGREKEAPKEQGRGSGRRDRRIQDLLTLGQEVLVRVSKEQIGGKGPTLTTYLSLPGRGVVLMPSLASRIKISSSIEKQEHRDRLLAAIEQVDPPEGMGYIFRTAAEEMDASDLERDLKYLLNLWRVIVDRAKSARAPATVYQESDLVIRTLRDLYSPAISEIVVDTEEAANKARDFLKIIGPNEVDRVKLHSGREPLFIKYGIETEIDRTYEKRVQLVSGGSIILEQTEALVAIDVNSGRFTQESDIEQTALRVNLEAAEEIAKQLRLRDLGGVIVNDFIDMRNLTNRKKVEKRFRDLLSNDRARTKMSQISQFGIIEMTRQRVGPSIKRYTHETCPQCEGHGLIKNLQSMTLHCMRKIHQGLMDKRIHKISITGNPTLMQDLQNTRRREISQLEEVYGKQISINPDPTLPVSGIVVKYSNGSGSKVEPQS